MKKANVLSAGLFVTLVSLVLFLVGPDTAAASEVPTCPVSGTSRIVSDLHELPPTLQTAILNKMGELANSTEPFDGTDVVVVGKNKRFAYAIQSGHRWVVVTEHGGMGYNNPIVAFDLGSAGAVRVVGEEVTFPNRVCRVARRLLLAK